jgi:K+ transporter
MIHTSETIQGQIYIPACNWALMIATIVLVAVFKNLQNLANAYGFAVATVMFSTSVLIAIQIPVIKHLPIVVGVAFFLTFGFFDGMFLFFLTDENINSAFDSSFLECCVEKSSTGCMGATTHWYHSVKCISFSNRLNLIYLY